MAGLSVASLPCLPVAGGGGAFRVGRVFCIGRNYPWGDGRARPPVASAIPWFMKPADTVCLAEGELPYPPLTREFCHEVELVVALGQGGRDLPVSAAWSLIHAYGVGLDLTRRDLQRQARAEGASWEPGKVFDQAAPCSVLQPAAQVGHLQRGRIWLSVNGQIRQQGDLSELMWSVPQLVSGLSRSITLKPGDLIFTGTPDGVGPLSPGDCIEAGIDGVAQLRVGVAGPQSGLAARPWAGEVA